MAKREAATQHRSRTAAQEAARLESEEAAVLAKIETSRLAKQQDAVKTKTQAAALEKEVTAKENAARWERKQQEAYLANSRQVKRPLVSKRLIHVRGTRRGKELASQMKSNRQRQMQSDTEAEKHAA